MCLFVHLSVACLDLIRELKDRKPKIGRMEAHHTINPWTYLEVKRSKIKVTRPINAITYNASYAGQWHYFFFFIVLVRQPSWWWGCTERIHFCWSRISSIAVSLSAFFFSRSSFTITKITIFLKLVCYFGYYSRVCDCWQVHKWVNYESMLSKCLVGRLVPQPVTVKPSSVVKQGQWELFS